MYRYHHFETNPFPRKWVTTGYMVTAGTCVTFYKLLKTGSSICRWSLNQKPASWHHASNPPNKHQISLTSRKHGYITLRSVTPKWSIAASQNMSRQKHLNKYTIYIYKYYIYMVDYWYLFSLLAKNNPCCSLMYTRHEWTKNGMFKGSNCLYTSSLVCIFPSMCPLPLNAAAYLNV
jgi:hypothetical protein